jgi:MoaA/NifB/PqqE/SkfB family radical SAM enzyme
VIRFVAIEVGDGAPLGCARCGASATPIYHPTDVVVARITAEADAWQSVPGPNVVLTGPEPFAHPALPELVSACVDAGFERIAIETDGRALATPAHATGALGAGVNHLYVRLLAAEEGRADALSGRPGLGTAVAVGIAAYRDGATRAGVTAVVTVVVPVCRHTIESLPSTIARLAAWEVDAVRLVKGGDLSSSSATLLAAACDTGMVNRVWVEADPSLGLPESHALHETPNPGGER